MAAISKNKLMEVKINYERYVERKKEIMKKKR